MMLRTMRRVFRRMSTSINLDETLSIAIEEHIPWYSYGHVGAIVWPSSKLLLRHLKQQPCLPPDIVELGSGTGILGIGTGALSRGNVVLTDRPPSSRESGERNILDLIETNVQLNPHLEGTFSILPLTWGDDELINRCIEQSRGGQGFGLVVGSDVSYHLPALGRLFYTARRLLRKEAATDEELRGFLISHQMRGQHSYETMLRAAADAGFAEPACVLKADGAENEQIKLVLHFQLHDGDRDLELERANLPPTPAPPTSERRP
jgi:hypothetical protein